MEALAVVDQVFSNDPVVVTCGATARELASIRVADNHLYLLDSMGLAGAVALGLALASPRPVAAIEGDGSLLMGLSVLASIAYHRPENLTLIVLDNHVHASADSFPTQSAEVSIAALSRGAGLDTHFTDHADELGEILAAARSSSDGPTAVVAEIEPHNEPGVPFLLSDPVVVGDRFQRFVEEDE